MQRFCQVLLVRIATSSVTKWLRCAKGERLSSDFSSLVRVSRMEGSELLRFTSFGHLQWLRDMLGVGLESFLALLAGVQERLDSLKALRSCWAAAGEGMPLSGSS